MPNYQEPGNNGYDLLHLVGRNPDVDTGSTPEDVWDGGGVYAFPAAAAETSIVSDSANDDSEDGSGARTVLVSGLDDDYLPISEVVELAGATPVVLANDFFRVNSVQVLSAGSGGVNAGTISVKHDSTVIAQVNAGAGKSLMAVYCVPATYKAAWLAQLRVCLGRAVAGAADLVLQVREFEGAWKTIESLSTLNTMDSVYDYPSWLKIEPRSDIRLRCESASANNTIVNASLHMLLAR